MHTCQLRATDLTADGTNTLFGSNDVPRTSDVNSEPGDIDLAGDAPALNANSGDDDLRFDVSRTLLQMPGQTTTIPTAMPQITAALALCNAWSKDPRLTDLTAHVDVNGTWDEV
jgi:hypothetical protein